MAQLCFIKLSPYSVSGKDIEPPQPGVSQRRKRITSLSREKRGLFWKPVQRETTGISQFSSTAFASVSQLSNKHKSLSQAFKKARAIVMKLCPLTLQKKERSFTSYSAGKTTLNGLLWKRHQQQCIISAKKALTGTKSRQRHENKPDSIKQNSIWDTRDNWQNSFLSERAKILRLLC